MMNISDNSLIETEYARPEIGGQEETLGPYICVSGADVAITNGAAI